MRDIRHKGIILAGGQGSRLDPLTKVISKQLLPVYDMPMIFYPLYTLVNSGIKNILIITNPEYVETYKRLLGNGDNLKVNISYEIQLEPKGIAQAFQIAEKWLKKSPSVLILGDNLFLAGDISEKLKNAFLNRKGATIFGYKVNDPSRYGVVDFNEKNEVISIEEKPKEPKSSWAVTGLYVYDNKVIEYSKNLKPSNRGELEITDINNIYLKNSDLFVEFIDSKSFWLDAGTKESLFEASSVVKDLKSKKVKLF